jgi:hypothetical protein
MSSAYIRQSTLLLLTFTEPEAFLKISDKSFKNNLNKFKVGNCLKHPVYFNGTLIRSASLYRYLGFTISSSGKFNQCKLDLYKKSMKAYFKLQNCLSSTNPSIDTFLHLYDHSDITAILVVFPFTPRMYFKHFTCYDVVALYGWLRTKNQNNNHFFSYNWTNQQKTDPKFHYV